MQKRSYKNMATLMDQRRNRFKLEFQKFHRYASITQRFSKRSSEITLKVRGGFKSVENGRFK